MPSTAFCESELTAKYYKQPSLCPDCQLPCGRKKLVETGKIPIKRPSSIRLEVAPGDKDKKTSQDFGKEFSKVAREVYRERIQTNSDPNSRQFPTVPGDPNH